MFDVRAVSRFFANPKAGRKCPCRNVLCARACSFLCPLLKSLEAYMLDYVALFPHHMLDASGLGSPFVQADGHRFSANMVL